MKQIQYLDAATQATKKVFRWFSSDLQMETQIVRWGHHGTPLLLFPTAAGDAEEVERFFLIKKLEPFIHDGRLKVYSVDSSNGETWSTKDLVPRRVWVQQQFDKFLAGEVVQLDPRLDNVARDVAKICPGNAAKSRPGLNRKMTCVVPRWMGAKRTGFPQLRISGKCKSSAFRRMP